MTTTRPSSRLSRATSTALILGDPSEAFNSMVERLTEKEKADRRDKEEFTDQRIYTRNQDLLIRVMNALPDIWSA